MKKSVKLDFEWILKQLNEEERNEALKWIDSLSNKEFNTFENRNPAHQAQAILEAYLKNRNQKKSRK